MKKFFKYSWMFVLPAVAAAVIWNAEATPKSPCPKDTDKSVLIANVVDCSSFYCCNKGVAILMHCPDGLHFNDKLNVCDWPQNAGCGGVYTCETDLTSKKGVNTFACGPCDLVPDMGESFLSQTKTCKK